MLDLSDRTAVITGASRGLGAGLASELLARGMNVAVCARREPPIDGGDRVLSMAADVTDAEAVDRLARAAVERFGRIDLWINNAGVLEPIAPLRACDSADVRQHLEINVLGVFHGSKAFVRHVRERDGDGVLVNVSSGAARSAYAGWSAYCASKAAVDRMSECIALEEADTGLRVHSVAPGVIDTDMQALIRSTSADDFPMVDKFHELKAHNAFSTIEHVAARLLELAFDPAHRTGEVSTSLPRPGQ